MGDERVSRVLDLYTAAYPKERTEAIGASVTLGGDRGYEYISAEMVFRVRVALSVDHRVSKSWLLELNEADIFGVLGCAYPTRRSQLETSGPNRGLQIHLASFD